MGIDMYQVENNLRTSPGINAIKSMCTDVVIGVVIGKTTAYCRLQRTKEYTKANYSLRAKSQTSSPPRREDSDSLVSTITQACCENNTVMEVKSMKSQNRCVGKTPDKSVHENPSTPSAQSERRVKTP